MTESTHQAPASARVDAPAVTICVNGRIVDAATARSRVEAVLVENLIATGKAAATRVRCPVHGERAKRIVIAGRWLEDVEPSVEGCCPILVALLENALGGPPVGSAR